MTRIDQAVSLIETHGPMGYEEAAERLGVTIRSMENAFRQGAMQKRLVCLQRGSSGHGIKAIYGVPTEGVVSVTQSARSYTDDILALLQEHGQVTTAMVAAALGIERRRASDALTSACRKKLLMRVGGNKNAIIYGAYAQPVAAKAIKSAATGAIRYGGYIGAARSEHAPWLDFSGWAESSQITGSRPVGFAPAGGGDLLPG